MEKRRRARINNCLNELKTLILDAMKKDVSTAYMLILSSVFTYSFKLRIPERANSFPILTFFFFLSLFLRNFLFSYNICDFFSIYFASLV